MSVCLSVCLSVTCHYCCFYQLCQLRCIRQSLMLIRQQHSFTHSDVACRLLQCNPRRAPKTITDRLQRVLNHCHQGHQEVWPGTVTTDAPGVTLAGHSRASKLQAGSTDPPVSARQGASVSIKLLHSSQSTQVASRRHLRSAARHQLTVLRHRLSTYGQWAFAVAGPTMFNALPDDLPYRCEYCIAKISAYQHV